MKERKRSLRGIILLLAVIFLLSGKDAMAASYSDWSTTYPSGQQGIESKTQYRYSDYVDRSGWKKTNSGSVTCVPEWPSGFDKSHFLYRDYAKTPVTPMNNGKVKREVTESNAGYIYWHWCRGYQYGPIRRNVSAYYDANPGYVYFHAFYSTTATNDPTLPSDGSEVRKYDNPGVCKDTFWYFPLEIVKQNYTDYTWDDSASYWTSWSDWSDTPYKASSTRKVEKRTVYRYKIDNEGQWLSSGGYWWYRHADGSCTKDGWEKIGDYWYHFDSAGWMQTGWIYIENNWYYLGSSGERYCCGWNWIDGNCYYFYDNGSIARNTKIDGCYVDWSGKWVKDQWINSGGYWWYRHGDGSCTKDDWEKIDGSWYHFDSSGWMQTGWIYIKNNWYYLGSNGKRCEGGWIWISGECYYFHSNGKMACDTTIDGKYVDSSGKAQVDKWVNSGGYWWYRHKDGSCTKNGWEKIDGHWYHFDSAGWMQTGWIYIENNWYYLDNSGRRCEGGWQWIGSNCYYFYSDGKMACNTTIDGSYVDSSGKWETDRWVNSGGYWWYRHKDGSCTKNNWEKIGDYWYHFDSAGWMQTGWLYLNGYWYYLNGSGQMCTGWVWVGSYCYYFYSGGSMARDTYIGGSYVDSSGCWLPNGKYELYIGTLQYLNRNYSSSAFYMEYGVCDINQDGVKELIVKYVPNEMDAKFWVYTIVQGNVQYIGDFSATHSTGLQTCSEGGVYAYSSYPTAEGHVRFIQHIYYENGKYVYKQVWEESYRYEPIKNPLPELLGDEQWITMKNLTDYSLLK